MKKVLRIFAVLFVIIILFTGISIPAFAIANPDSITLYSAKVFENIFEDGDMLFVMRYDLDYASEPDESADEAFLIQLLHTDGSTLLLSRPINYYQHNLISIYATASQVTSLSLTWESAYVIRLTGNPALFGTLTDGVNVESRTLSVSDYNPDGSLTSLELLRIHCLDIADILETDWAITLITTSTLGTQILNSSGMIVFLAAIPNLNAALPSLFQLASSIPVIDSDISDATYAVESQLPTRLGTPISNSFTGIGNFLGIGTNSAAGLWALIFILTVASIIFLNSGNGAAALILSVPIIVAMTYVGAIPEAITYVLTIFVVIYGAYYFWLRGT